MADGGAGGEKGEGLVSGSYAVPEHRFPISGGAHVVCEPVRRCLLIRQRG